MWSTFVVSSVDGSSQTSKLVDTISAKQAQQTRLGGGGAAATLVAPLTVFPTAAAGSNRLD